MAFIVFSVSFADTKVGDVVSNEEKVVIGGEEISADNVIKKTEEGVEKVTTGVNNLAMKIIEQISDKSLPICAILILWGAVLYFIQGIRNLYKKKQGMLLMWGSFTFLVIAKFVNLIFWFVFAR